MLKIENIKVEIANKVILDDFSLELKAGEIHAIMGPNGVGKSTLAAAIMGNPQIQMTSGKISLDNQDISNLSVDQRARLGVFLAFQNPSEIEGVSNLQFLKAIINANQSKKIAIFDLYKKVEDEKKHLNMPEDYLKREVNFNFSGGEKKRNEIMQMSLLSPKVIILDELDSGLDVDSLKLVCQKIKSYQKNDTIILIITHYPRILKYLKPNYVHVMKNGSIKETGDINLAYKIEEAGYENDY